MEISIDIKKGIPVEQIEKFEDKVVYNTAITTREYTKSRKAYPYLTGKLQASEVAAPIIGIDKEYSLLSGVDYAVYVYGFKNANWTNPSTQPQWYYTNFNNKGAVLLLDAVMRAKKEIK